MNQYAYYRLFFGKKREKSTSNFHSILITQVRNNPYISDVFSSSLTMSIFRKIDWLPCAIKFSILLTFCIYTNFELSFAENICPAQRLIYLSLWHYRSCYSKLWHEKLLNNNWWIVQVSQQNAFLSSPTHITYLVTNAGNVPSIFSFADHRFSCDRDTCPDKRIHCKYYFRSIFFGVHTHTHILHINGFQPFNPIICYLVDDAIYSINLLTFSSILYWTKLFMHTWIALITLVVNEINLFRHYILISFFLSDSDLYHHFGSHIQRNSICCCCRRFFFICEIIFGIYISVLCSSERQRQFTSVCYARSTVLY